MITKSNTHCVIVLYRPSADVLGNIRSHIEHVSRLYIVDNTETPDPEIAAKLKKLQGAEYIPVGGNKGIAWALNKGARLAIENKAEWLLTMDQDSVFEGDMYRRFTDTANRLIDESVALFSPYHHTTGDLMFNTEWDVIDAEMTSGNLLLLSAYQKTEGFNNDLFIDYVDWDFCLQLRVLGFRLFRLNHVILLHHLGEAARSSVLGVKEIATHHSPLRRYYITRNRMYVWKHYGSRFRDLYIRDSKAFRKELLKIIFFEKDKLKKLKMVFRGYRDFKKNRFGVYGE